MSGVCDLRAYRSLTSGYDRGYRTDVRTKTGATESSGKALPRPTWWWRSAATPVRCFSGWEKWVKSRSAPIRRAAGPTYTNRCSVTWDIPMPRTTPCETRVLHTGDIGQLDSESRLFVRDRRNALILRGGANVYPAEVERVLLEAPGVKGASVIGVPDERLGQRVAVMRLSPERAASALDLPDPFRVLCCAPGALQSARVLESRNLASQCHGQGCADRD